MRLFADIERYVVITNIVSGLTYNRNLMYDMYFVLFEKFIEKVFRYSADLERGRGVER